jgi:hypothetical protein
MGARPTLMGYHEEVGPAQSLATYTYDGDGLKWSEHVSSTLTTLVWDGDEYLGEI